MNANLTELVLILDRSGSMESVREETIAMVNAVVAGELGAAGEQLDLTVALFDTEVELVTDGMRISKPRVLTQRTYRPDGCTALHDAVVSVITHVGARLAARDEALRPSAVVVAIITDGLENASTKHTLADVRRVIEHQCDVYNWQFLFLGANQDSWATGQGMGLMRDDTKDWTATPDGMQELGSAMLMDVQLKKMHARRAR
jgi:uncharacterized protein with von Willebrand factor type A (vWA) domain